MNPKHAFHSGRFLHAALEGNMKGTLPARIALLTMLAYGSTLANADTCYVNGAATGSNNATSWTNAYTDLQLALGNYLGCNQIWIARGTYKPTATPTARSASTSSPAASFDG
jgi:hypothetical protein